jgi:DNA repair protein SbcC/Rad50
MRIKKVKLENIRSYLDNEIVFPEKRSLMLSGNIGSGKSTILLAIEFALFGIRRGELSGGALLRNGADRGSVEVSMIINGKNVEIKRTLKRGSSIAQDTGYIVVNGEKMIGTAIELKDKVLELLNYPKELLTKTKSIYRYTVYTPQEEMKTILMGDDEIRVSTLRRVFGFDKYKRVRDNAGKVVARLRETLKIMAGSIADYEDKVEMRDEKEKERLELEKDVEKYKSMLKKLEDELDLLKISMKSSEKKLKELEEIKRIVSVDKVSVEHLRKTKEQNLKRLEDLKQAVKILGEELEKDVIVEESLIEEKRNLLKAVEKKIDETNKNIFEIEGRSKHSLEIKEKVSELKLCPVCKQSVPSEHKHVILIEEDKKIKKLMDDIENLRNILLKFKEKRENAKKELDELDEKLRKREIFELKKKSYEEKRKEVVVIEENIKSSDEKINEIEAKMVEYSGKLEGIDILEREFEKWKLKVDGKSKEIMDIRVREAAVKSKTDSLWKSISELEKEIEVKKKVKKKISYFMELKSWFDVVFINLMETIEKNIMMKVHNDFNGLFEKWFNMLVDSETLAIRLDYDFAPVIIQNGHEIEYSYLSGGERTAAALAYRLALNQVINNIVSTVNTRDLLILDEPTDGFSDEQIDRLRNLIDELSIGQLILVSHDAKIESFVDHVIRLEKREHVSRIL